MPQADNQNEVAPKEPTLSESVESVLEKKETQKESTEAPQVQESATAVQHEVSEVMGGVEKPKEYVSEQAGEKGEKKGATKRKAAAAQQDDSQAHAGIQQYVFPSEEVMIKKVRLAIKADIDRSWKKAKNLQKNLTTGGAQEYSSVIAHIRSLKEVLESLLTATFDFAKNLYQKYFTPDGKRRKLEEV